MLVDQFGGQIVSGLAGNLGLGEADARGAIDGALPSILGGLINKVGTSAGTDELFDIVNDDQYGGGMLDNLGSLFGGGENSSLLQTGLKLLPLILGGGSKMGTVLDIAGRVFGGGAGRSKSVFGMLAPLVISFIGKRLRGGNGMSKSGLVDLLLGQKQNVATRANPEIAREMGFSHWLDRTANVSESHHEAGGYREETTHTTTHHAEQKTGGGFPKWLWPLLLLGLLGFLAFSLMRGCGGTEVERERTIDRKQDTQIERKAAPEKKIEGNRQPVKNQKPVVNNQIKNNTTKTNQVVSSQPVRNNTTTTTTTTNTNTNTGVTTTTNVTRPGKTTTTSTNSGGVTTTATNTRPGRGNTSTANTGGTTTTTTTTGKPTRAGATTTTTSTGTTGTATGGTRAGTTQGGSTYTGASKQFNDAATSGSSSVINFGSVSQDGKALSASARAQLDQIAAIMKANPNMSIEVRGHNKDHGNKVQNGSARAASKVRAKLVEAHLVTKGIGASRIKTKSLGHDEVLGGVAGTDDRQKRITIRTM